MFGIFSLLRKRKELIPIVGLMAVAASAATATSLYFLTTKSDVIVDRRGNPTPWENIDPKKPQKLMTVTQKWEPVEELKLLKRFTK